MGLLRRASCDAALFAGLMIASASSSLMAQVSVTTWRYDISRSGQNPNETTLTTANVNPSQFGKLFSQPVDGYIYAEPLYLPNVVIGGTSHNVIFVATEHDSVYAFDADSNSGANGSPLWFASMLSTTHGAASGATSISSNILGTDIIPEIGITGTPVIDPSSGTLYVVSASQEGSSFVQRLHALDVTTGAEKFGGPTVITASVSGTGNGSVGGTLTFDSEWQNNRPGLLLLNGIVYLGFGSHGDNGPWHGWIMGYNAQTLKQTGVFCTSPNGVGSGIWMGGAGLAAEVIDPVNHPFGRMFVATGNGDYTATKPYAAGMDYGDSVLNLDLTSGVPTITDEFTPADQATLDQYDGDQGSAGVLILPTQTTGSYPHLLVQAGKSGSVFVLNRDNLGGYNPGGDQVVQELPYGVGNVGTWATAAYWNNMVYYWGEIHPLQAFPLSNGQLVTPALTSSESYNFPGADPVISSNGNTNAVLWTIDSEAFTTGGSQVLQAHSAANPGTTLYSSSTNSSRDNPGGAVKFSVPTVANGKVYVGSASQISVYGLLNGTPTAAPPILNPGTETFTGTLQVSITDSTSGATIYYTLDGTTPTVSSSVYSGPLTISATTTIQAMAIATGYLESQISSDTYTSNLQVNAPNISPGGGTFAQPVSVTITDTTPGATIYYTTDGSAPTTSSAKYTAPLTVSVSETVNAIAAETGYSNSPLASASFGINTGGTTYINYAANGFTATNLSLNNGATVTGGMLQLTDGGTGEDRSAWFATPVQIGNFATDFTFQQLNATADGMTFTIQNSNVWALGYPGSGLGSQGIANSVTVKFDLYNNSGEGNDSTGFYLNGAIPTTPAIDLSSTGVNLHSGDLMHAHIAYNGQNLTMTLTDTVTNATVTETVAVNIPATVGGSTAYVGFTGSTGGSSATQNVLSWSFVYQPSQTVATPTFSPGSGTYTSAQSVTIGEVTPGATIYYTTNGTTPTTSSSVYSGPITVSASETVEALGVESGYTSSSVASAAYNISPVLPAPTFSPAAGTYPSAQSVTISDSTPGTTIYYTTDGTSPTTSSSIYGSPITVSSAETLQAMAVEAGYANSSVASAAYTINSGINFPIGFSGTQGVVILNGSGGLDDTRLQLTNGGANEASSAWYFQPVNIQSFTTDFSFQLSNPGDDGITFAIQSNGSTALGSPGAGLGYQGIANSLAIKFDFYNDAGEGADSTGLYLNGASPTVPAIDLSNTGIDLHSDDTMDIHLAYNGTVLSMSIFDLVTGEGYSTNWTVNIPSIVGGNSAYLGFTGGSAALSSSQKILTWVYSAGSPTAPIANSPAFNPPAGSYSGNQSVSMSDAISGASIYYTTDGSTPTTSSAKYGSPVTVGASETLRAIAVASGYSNSSVAQAAYAITPVLPAPTFTPAPGTYTTSQNIAISDSTAGTTIYYTTNGTTPTTSSAVYSGSITVSATETLEAIATETGYANSPVTSGTYNINPLLPAPTFSPAAGSYTSTQSVTISDATAGTTIYYTTNGTTPTTSSAVYTSPIAVSATETLEAIAAETGYTTSAVGTAAYTITPILPAPTFSPVAGTYTSAQTVTISDATSGTTIYYTTNGTTPTTSSTKYKSAIAVSSSETVEALAVKSGSTNSPVATAVYTINTVLPTPTFSPAAGTYTSAQSVTISDSTAGTTIYYTTNGTTPTTSSTKYAGPVSVSASETLEAIAVETGFTNSPVATAAYTINLTLPAPTFTPGAGTYTSSQSVTISDSTAGTTIYYTTNGTAPTTSSTKYVSPVSVSASETLEAIAVEAGYTNSPIATAVYTINPVLPVPTFSPAAGSYSTSQPVTISDSTAGTTIYYTTNGTTPTTSSTKYTVPVNVSASETLEAIAVETGYTNSPVATAVYTINLTLPAPTFSPAAGTYTTGQSVTISDSTGTTIYYTTNGTTPTVSSTKYAGPVSVSASETLEAIAVETGFTNSPVATAVYNITPVLPAPSFSPAAGTYTSAQSVSISDATPGTTIYYTTDGSTPTSSSTLYTAAVSVSSSETLKAIAIESGYANSSIGTGVYTISSGSTTYINYPSNGVTASSLSLNYGATVTGGLLQLTDGGLGEVRSAWFNSPVPVTAFTTDFTFQQLNAAADGMTFTIQGSNIWALGYPGAGLGSQGIGSSVSIKFDLYNNAGEGNDSTGIYTGGAIPTVPAIDLSSTGINFHSGDLMHAHLVYNGTNLTMTLTDTVTNATVTEVFPVNIPSLVGGNTA